jgi:signal transduction histidine kinase
MVPADDRPANRYPDGSAEALAQLHHELKTPLTVIAGRAYLLARAIQRSPALTEEERAGMLAGLAIIDGAVLTLVAVINAIGQEDGAG